MDDKIKEYWDKKILDWEKNAYEESTSGQSLVEKVASKFRGSLRERMNIALALLQPHVGGQTILDLGCGSGTFCFRLLQYGRLRRSDSTSPPTPSILPATGPRRSALRTNATSRFTTFVKPLCLPSISPPDWDYSTI